MAKWITPLLKWPGGKSDELDGILPLLPDGIVCYREPFLGGGAVWWNIPSNIPAVVGDASCDLVAFYRLVREPSERFLFEIGAACDAWERAEASWGGVVEALSGSLLLPKEWNGALPASRSRRKEPGDPRHLRKAALYALWRAGFNAALPDSDERAAGFWLMRELAYNGMFRSNASGGFNVPYGGLSYDGRNLAAKAARMRGASHLQRLASTTLVSGDFSQVLHDAHPGDFIFLDPPYDSPFSTYDGKGFGRSDHRRLAEVLSSLPDGVRWLMVISSTEFVEDTYLSAKGAKLLSRTPVRYRSNIKNRFDSQAEHLTLGNYLPG